MPYQEICTHEITTPGLLRLAAATSNLIQEMFEWEGRGMSHSMFPNMWRINDACLWDHALLQQIRRWRCRPSALLRRREHFVYTM